LKVQSVLIGACLATALCAQTIDQYLDTIRSTTHFHEVAMSPDGRWIAWTVDLRNKDNTLSHNSEVLVAPSNGASNEHAAQPHRLGLSRSAHPEHSPAFSPDSSQIAFLASAEKGSQLQLYIESTQGGSPHKLTSLKGFLESPRWSPDGKILAVLFTENAVRSAGPLEPAARDSGVVEQRLYEQRLLLLDASTGTGRAITPADTYVYEYDWSPDSKRIAYTAAKGNGDNNWWIAKLFSVDIGTGGVHEVHKPETQIAFPRWSPDGREIAYIGGLMSDEGSTGGDIYIVPAVGGAARDVTRDRKSSVSWIRWLPDGRMLFTETVDGGSAVVAMKSGVAETLWRKDESITAGEEVLSVSRDGKNSATIRMSWSNAPEVWDGPTAQWSQRTHANDSLKPLWGKTEKLHWKSDRFSVEGWLMYPVHYDASHKYPVVVSVHGGPAAALKPSWPSSYNMAALSSQGYFVFFPNPRGSYGEGESFTRANVRDFGYGDLRDIMRGVDAVVESKPVDPNRLGIAGWSYGGYMTMWAVTQTNRFHAAVAGAGISNWQSYYGENLIDQWMIPYFGASVYDDPAIYARSSPITYIKNVRTPTLILVGDSDEECPAPQSYEFWHALKTEGVKTQFVVYPNEGHAVRQPEHQRDLLDRTVRWFNENLKSLN
jgi:dipeptidyl aminopeptidase/acylaminoacyl peptidase